ncbi:probable methylthioribose-1-phosphate isomerase at N-terminal half [Coccomyxa sp. Obi]|nr:probable methylthioribose-1-phosphate isomerase at N-terminal half [Coccomyxa sp. Obi]
MGALEAIRWQLGPPASLKLLDQRILPLQSVYMDINGPKGAFTAIKDMAVRGAPAIAIAAALALAVDLVNQGGGAQFSSAQAAYNYITEQLDYLVTSRPTAVNLQIAANRLSAIAKKEASEEGGSGLSVTVAVISAADAMLKEDITANKTVGKLGAEGILAELASRNGRSSTGVRMLTHCNTGSLATAAYGTALGVVRALHAAGSLQHAYCTETRPYNQGSRLTAYELVHDGLPSTLIADSAAAALMAQRKVDAIVVGADRIAANGDTANKIGTFSLAVNAAHHGIPFYIAAHTTTVDPTLADGSLIPIEERSGTELTHHQGQRVAAPGINVWNPGFDVTPAKLITGIITEHGIIQQQDGIIDVNSFLREHGLLEAEQPKGNGTSSSLPTSNIPGFRALNTETVKDYLAERPDLSDRVGPSHSKDAWSVREVGDGNINFVYIVEGPSGALVVKQGLPYIRIAHDWPLTQERAKFEAEALREEARHCPEHVPELYHYDAALCLLVMQYLPPPHLVLRPALTAGRSFPKLARHIAHFMATTLFRTSLFALDSKAWRELVRRFENVDICRLTEQVIFTDPYYSAPVNRHTSPQLDDLAHAFQHDVEAKAAVTALKAKFVQQRQALLHGDLHTGSLMVTEDTTYVIDAEFAFAGPIAFDVAKMVANLLIAFFAGAGLQTPEAPRTRQRQWLLQAIVEMWASFVAEFKELWTASVKGGKPGDLCPTALFGVDAPAGPASLEAVQEDFFQGLLPDVLGFAGAVIIRRILGIAHVVDYESIQNADSRAAVERRSLQFARRLLVETSSFGGSMEAVVKAAAASDSAYVDELTEPHKQ